MLPLLLCVRFFRCVRCARGARCACEKEHQFEMMTLCRRARTAFVCLESYLFVLVSRPICGAVCVLCDVRLTNKRGQSFNVAAQLEINVNMRVDRSPRMA